MPRFFKSLFGQVVLALIAGVVVGLAWPDTAIALKPLGDGFIKLIKICLLYTSPSPRDRQKSRMPSSA